MNNRMNIGHILIAGRSPPNFKDLKDRIFGAIKCLGKNHSDQSLVYWNTICLVCGLEKVMRTFYVKKGRCTNCKAIKAPEPAPTELQQVS